MRKTNSWNRLLSIMLCICMVLTLLPAGAFAATEQYVEFTVGSLGLGDMYTSGSAIVDGVAVEWVQLGNYGDGIQMRDRNDKTSMLWNTTALSDGISKIELVYSDTKSCYSNTDCVIFHFGNEAKGTEYSTKLSTTAGTKTYTITPDAETYTYFYIEHDFDYTLYWKSIKVYYGPSDSEVSGHSYDENGFCINCDNDYQPCEGSGTEEDPYTIGNAGQLYWFASKVNNGDKSINAVLIEDIVVNEGVMTESSTDVRVWTPIGNESFWYGGTFDGNGHTISGLYFNDLDARYVGLFGTTHDATIQNVGVENSCFIANHFVGGVVGTLYMGTVTNCYNTGTVTGGFYVGGVVASAQETIVSNCYNTGTVTATGYEGKVGGVVAYSYGTVINCYNTGTVNGTREVGGVVGNNRVDSTVSNCYNTADVFGTEYVGGVVGFNDTNGKITNCYYLYDGGIMIGGVDGGDREGSAESKKVAAFASGEVAYLLGEGWGQTIGTDEMPILGGATIYRITDCSGGTAYSNTDENGTHIWKAADCGAPKTCTVCGVTEGEVVGTHNWVDATCTKPKTCDACGLTEGEALGHRFGQEETCTVCGIGKYINFAINMMDRYSDSWSGNAINIYEDDVLIGTATIEEGGSAVWTYQGDCTKTYKMEWVLGSWADECSFELLIDDEVVLTASTNDCVGYSDGYIIYPACAHSYDYVVVSPTCTESGYTTYTCTLCDHSVVSNWTNAAGHIAVEGSGAVTEPTCTVDGYTTYVCATCGEDYQWNIVFAEGHTPIEGSGVVTAPTCGEEGYTTYTCATCGEQYKTDTVEKLPHPGFDSNGFCTSCGNGYQPCGGSGTEDDPYAIGNAGQLYWFAEQVNNGNEYACAILTADIVVNEGTMSENATDVRTWIMIGRENFCGIFDGQDHTISGLYFNDSEVSYVGLIGFLCEGSVKNVGVINSWLSGNSYVGGVVGEAYKSTVTNCFNSGTIMGSGWDIGGVVGNNNCASTIENCYNTGAITGTYYDFGGVGGVVGDNYESAVMNCYNTGSVNGVVNVGGVVGSNYGTMMDCYNTGAVSGERDVGGVVGHVAGLDGDVDEITNCYNTGAVKGGSNVGGVSGSSHGIITECYNTGDVAGGGDKLGGVVGHNNYGTVTNCYNTGSITGSECIGGVVGDNYESTVMNCYNTGVVTGDNCVGGIAGYDGWSGSTLANCYNMGVVNCETDWFGGVAGYSGGSVVNCYYLDDEGRYQGGINVGGPGFAEGKTTAQFASGEVANLLGEGWGQAIGTDNHPVLGGDPVYRNQVGGCNDYTYVYGYSNTQAEPVITHTFADATCTKPKICSICKATEGQPLGHSYGEDGYCTTCGGHENDMAIVIEMLNPSGVSTPWWACYIDIYEDGVLIGTATKTDWEDVNLWTYTGDKTKAYTMKWRKEWEASEDCTFVVKINDVVVLSASGEDSAGYSDGQIIYPVCTNHNYQTTVYAPACVDWGYTEHKCTVCGNNYKENWVSSLGHTPIEGSAVVTPPTCYDWGYTTYTCSVCGENYYSDSDWVENTGHTPAEGSGVVTAPTCGAVGYTTYTCASCGEKFTGDEVPKLPHVAYDSKGFCLVCDGYQPCGGSGTEEDPYTIGNAGQLYWFAEQVNSQSWLDGVKSFYAVLTANIVVNEGVMTQTSTGVRAWVPIGSSNCSFSGTFDGAGYTISGLYHFYDTKDEDSQNFGYGLFGYVNNATIKNVGVINSTFTGWFAVGGVVGYSSETTVQNCFSSCLIFGNDAIGGVVGYSDYCTMDNCYNTGTVTSTTTGDEWHAGGIVGNSFWTTIKNCYNAGTVTGNNCVGGIAGEAYGTVENCYSIGAVVGTGKNVGGIASDGGYSIFDCYYLDGSVSGANGEGATFGEAKTAAQFASGEVAYLLQNGYTEQVWGQAIGTDVAPTLGGETVYRVDNCNGDAAYSNADEPLGHSYTNGVCSVCGDVKCAITQKGRNLSYEDLIYVIDIFELIGVEGIDLTKDAGLLIWSVDEFNALDEIAFDAEHANPGLKPYRNTGYYYGSSEGIFTRDLYKEAYYVGYVKLADGSYVYSEPKLYSPAIYAYSMLSKSSTSAETKELCVALLNYISAAQMYFDKSTPAENLVNADLSDEQKTLNWENISFNLAPEVSADKQVERNTNVFTGTGKNLLFEEMISIVSIFKIDNAIIADAKEYGTIYWTAEQFAALNGTPSIDNIGAGTKTGMSVYRGNAGQWYSQAPEIAAKNMADTQYFYLGYVVHADGTVSYSGVQSYTVEQYISNTVAKESTSDEMRAFAQWLYFYERAAKEAI